MPARMSVYERREFGWRDRLRRLVGRENAPTPLCKPLRLVVERGRPAGYRGEDGSVLRLPEPSLGHLPDDAWISVAGIPRDRWI